MKALFVLSVLFITTNVFAQAVENSTGNLASGNCYVQAKNIKYFSNALHGLTENDVIFGAVRDTLVGELDPNVLGDGGLTAIQTNSGTYLVFESNESAFMTSTIQQNAKRGLKVIAILKSCLNPVKAQNQKKVMRSLAQNIMSIPGPFKYLKLN